MTREIKFRAWDGERIIYHPPVSTYDSSVNDEFYFAESGQSGKTFMQYTGLKDKNGKDIYEGDMLYRKDTSTTGQVIFNDGKFIIKWKSIAEYVMIDSEIITSYNDEIIGNIYENPNLI